MEDNVEPEDPQGSGCAGAAVITTAVLALGAAVYLITDTGFVLVFWAVGWWLVIRAARKKVPGTPDPAPPPPSERGGEKDPQVRMVRDTAHPNRWVVTRPSKWLSSDFNDKETGTK